MKRYPIEPGQESVWDYPRPPRLEASSKPVRVEFNGQVIARTTGAFRVLETSHPPVYYIPPEDIVEDALSPDGNRSWCEWKGHAVYWSVRVGERESRNAGWSYPDPTPEFAPIRGFVAFYPDRVGACYVGEERVQAQAGGFYGGWITSDIVGPFKGEPGSQTW